MTSDSTKAKSQGGADDAPVKGGSVEPSPERRTGEEQAAENRATESPS
jgi:hypothetical protein